MKSAIAKIEKILKLTHSPEPNEARAAAVKAIDLMTTHKVSISYFHNYDHEIVHSFIPKPKRVKKPKPKAKKLKYEPQEFVASIREIKKRSAYDISYSKYFSQKYSKQFKSMIISKPEQQEATRLINDVWLWQWFHRCISSVFSNYGYLKPRFSMLSISPFTSTRTVVTPQAVEFNINYYGLKKGRRMLSSKPFLKLKISKLGNQEFIITIYADKTSQLQNHKPSKIYFPNYRTSFDFTVSGCVPNLVYKFILDTLYSVAFNYERKYEEDESLYDFEEETTIDTHIKNEKFEIRKAINF